MSRWLGLLGERIPLATEFVVLGLERGFLHPVPIDLDSQFVDAVSSAADRRPQRRSAVGSGMVVLALDSLVHFKSVNDDVMWCRKTKANFIAT